MVRRSSSRLPRHGAARAHLVRAFALACLSGLGLGVAVLAVAGRLGSEPRDGVPYATAPGEGLPVPAAMEGVGFVAAPDPSALALLDPASIPLAPSAADPVALRPGAVREAAGLPTPPAPRPASVSGPVLVIVLDLTDTEGALQDRVIALPPPLTLILSASQPDAARRAGAAGAAGHEVLLDLALEPAGRHPGPFLPVAAGPAEIAAELEGLRERVPGAAGVATRMGSRFTADDRAMAALAAALQARGLVLLDRVTTPATRAVAVASRAGVPALARTHGLEGGAAGLLRAVQSARRRGLAVAVGRPTPELLAALASGAADGPGLARRRLSEAARASSGSLP